MVEYFKTLTHYSSDELIIKKSRFIGHAKPVRTEEEAVRFIEEIRKMHPQATHNCYAYLAGDHDQWQKFSDDGEPSGTAGRPILEVIKHQGLQNTAIVVTRYYGGIMLGAGGLVRAYTDGAVIGIEAAKPVYQVLHQEILVEVDYTWLGKLENELRNRQVMTEETQFTDKVTLVCLPRYSQADAFIAWMTDLTQGRGVIMKGEARYVAHAEPPDPSLFS